jgi:diguanylate cyclase (GGDEF)-like protein
MKRIIILSILFLLTNLLILEFVEAAGTRKLSNQEWEVYWNQLMDPKDFTVTASPSEMIKIPSSWRERDTNGKAFPNFGYATYRLKFRIPKEDIGKNKALYFEGVGSAYQLWINGRMQGSVGSVGRNRSEEIPLIQARLYEFKPIGEWNKILMHISNFSFREGGLIGEVHYGESTILKSSIDKGTYRTIFIIGGFFFIGLYHLIIFIIRKPDSLNLLLALGSFVGALRTYILNNQLVYLHFPQVSWEFLTKLEYLTELLGFFLLILFMKKLYPEEIHKIPLQISYAFTVLVGSYILLSPSHIYTRTLMVQVLIISVILLYFVFYVGMMAAFRKREGAVVNLIGIFIIILAAVNDALVYTNVIHTIVIFDYSILLFLLFQAVVVSYRYSLLLIRNHQLTFELVKMNNTLEEKVADRTKQLDERNKELYQMAMFDGLTGVHNRRRFTERVREWLQEPSKGLALMLFDIDHFKRVNDTYGHMAGDQVLVEFAAILKRTLSDHGIVGRVGGEEFGVCLIAVTAEEALAKAEQMRMEIENTPIFLKEPFHSLRITASCGIAFTKNGNSHFEQLYHIADQALYMSKETGKNKVTMAPS